MILQENQKQMKVLVNLSTLSGESSENIFYKGYIFAYIQTSSRFFHFF